MWKVDPWRLYHIGDFFTDLAREILGGEKTAGSQDSGDIDNWELDTQIEVKGRGNKKSLDIYLKQLNSEIAQLGFPFTNLWYTIFFTEITGETKKGLSVKKLQRVNLWTLFSAKILWPLTSLIQRP
jgi:hypothetical protein